MCLCCKLKYANIKRDFTSWHANFVVLNSWDTKIKVSTSFETIGQRLKQIFWLQIFRMVFFLVSSTTGRLVWMCGPHIVFVRLVQINNNTTNVMTTYWLSPFLRIIGVMIYWFHGLLVLNRTVCVCLITTCFPSTEKLANAVVKRALKQDFSVIQST